MSDMDVKDKLKILKRECGDKGLDQLSMILYKGFTDKLEKGFELKPHDIQYVEDMWKIRQEHEDQK